MTEEFDGIIGIVYQKRDANKFLLIYNQETGNISFPAGGREQFETSSIQTLNREMLEETGLAPQDYIATKTHLIYEFTYNTKKNRAGQKSKQAVYLIKTGEKNLKPKDPQINIYGWYTAEDVMNKLSFKELKELFKKVKVQFSTL